MIKIDIDDTQVLAAFNRLIVAVLDILHEYLEQSLDGG